MAKYTKEKRELILNEWKRNTQSKIKFCIDKSISTSTLNNWLRNNNKYRYQYSLWLPMNKDIFGFSKIKNAPLNDSDKIKIDSIEEVAYLHIMQTIERKINLKYSSIKYRKKENPVNFFNHSRMLKFEIEKDEQAIGIFQIFSNGLYLWSFEEAQAFDEDYLKILFDTEGFDKFFEQTDNEKKNYTSHINLKNYNGILNYFQIELLFNGLFDINISPSNYFGVSDLSNVFTLENILKSILLEHHNNEINTVTNREKYSCKLDTDEKKYLCIFSASMEQFIRVTNTFSSKHYKRGLDFCLKQLSTHGLLRSHNAKGEIKTFLPDSLYKIKASIASLESYQTLIFEKLPLIEYFNTLIYGLSETIDVDAKSESKYKKKLMQAIRQNKRRLLDIENIFKSIENSLYGENQKNILKELYEIRKYTEINNEMMINRTNSMQEEVLQINQKSNDRMMSFMVFLTLVITFLSPMISFAVQSDKHTVDLALKNLDFLSVIITLMKIPYIYIPILIGVLYKLFNFWFAKKPTLHSRHIFDNTSPSYHSNRNNKEDKSGKFVELMKFFEEEKLTEELPSMESPSSHKVECLKVDTLQERFNTYKKYTFSFYAKEINGIKYILHIDIHYNLYISEGEKSISVEDIRIVILNNSNKLSSEEIHRSANEIKELIYSKIYENVILKRGQGSDLGFAV